MKEEERERKSEEIKLALLSVSFEHIFPGNRLNSARFTRD